MKIYLGSDHAGFEIKEGLKAWLKESGYEVVDSGPENFNVDDDYPDYIAPVAREVSMSWIAGDKSVYGIILGHSGEGEAIVANRFPEVRATVYYGGSNEILILSKEHNDANILSLGVHFLDLDQARNAVKLWLEKKFTGEERHIRRIAKIESVK